MSENHKQQFNRKYGKGERLDRGRDKTHIIYDGSILLLEVFYFQTDGKDRRVRNENNKKAKGSRKNNLSTIIEFCLSAKSK